MMFGSGMMAQDVIRLGITKTDVSQFALKTSLWESLLMVDLTQPNALTTISDKLVSAYTNDPGFKVIDYRSYDLVADERERQKGEEFIDGYIVEPVSYTHLQPLNDGADRNASEIKGGKGTVFDATIDHSTLESISSNRHRAMSRPSNELPDMIPMMFEAIIFWLRS